MNNKLLSRAAVHAGLAFAYIVCIALGLRFTAKDAFSSVPDFFAPIIMLTLLVLSAAVMAVLIFGKPVLLYLDNQKKDAITLLFYTLGCLAAIFVAVVLVLIMVY